MFGYLKKHHNDEMLFDPSEPSVYQKDFKRKDWSSNIYGEIKEEVPPNMPDTRSLVLKMIVYVDSNHSGDLVTQ